MRLMKFLTVAVAVMAAASGRLGAQDIPDCITGKPSDPVKWSQPVDIDNGWDVFSFGYLDTEESIIYPMAVVADDWKCLDGLPVTDFHWWGSYIDGGPGQGLLGFEISIHSDVPAGHLGHPSHPGDRLWWTLITLPQAHETFYATAPDHDIYQYFFELASPELYFYQQQGTIYWLDIMAIVIPEDTIWGWHTGLRPGPENGLDAAVMMQGYDVYTGEYTAWASLYDEQGPVQMAFELTTVPEPATLILVGTAGLSLLRFVRRRRMSR
jgi:hypothetical protein